MYNIRKITTLTGVSCLPTGAIISSSILKCPLLRRPNWELIQSPSVLPGNTGIAGRLGGLVSEPLSPAWLELAA